MFVGLKHDLCVRVSQPGVYMFQGFVDTQRLGKHFGIGCQAQEAKQRQPAQADRLLAGKGLFPPLTDCVMMMRVLVDGVEQNVEVDDLHLRAASLLITCSSSRAAASARARS